MRSIWAGYTKIPAIEKKSQQDRSETRHKLVSHSLPVNPSLKVPEISRQAD